MPKPIDLNAIAKRLYEVYSNAVGGKNFQGDALPTWEVFSGDPDKQLQADAWRSVAANIDHAKEIGKANLDTDPIAETKLLRKEMQDLYQTLETSARQSRPRSIARTKLEEASMWLGKDLQALGQANPYPNSHDPSNLTVDPTAADAIGAPGSGRKTEKGQPEGGSSGPTEGPGAAPKEPKPSSAEETKAVQKKQAKAEQRTNQSGQD